MAHPEVKCQMNRIYNSSFPGSVLWDLTAPYTAQIINSWSVSVRQIWDLPRNSHRNFIESLGGTHAKVMLMSRYIGFIQSLQRSSRLAVLYLYQRCRNNVMTVTGKNINYIENEVEDSSILNINLHKFKKTYKFAETKDEDAWKVCFVREIVNIKQNILHFDQDEEQFTAEELDELLDYLVTS